MVASFRRDADICRVSDQQPELLAKLNAAFAGRYAVTRELGRGGMATVYLANDVKHDREVAIKVLHPDLAATVGGGRFEREIRLAAKLQHPHILGMFDSGDANGLLYYVMPFVKGESLRDRIDREGMLPIEDAVQITLEVNDALGHAHKQGIIHRDIKPENILLADGHALVADFGIARLTDDAGGQKLTQTGMSMGTPYYMAPEQASGEMAGPTSDIYALGCVLYEMLSGDPPFTGKNAMQIMARHAMEQVPSIRIVRQVVPEEIENAIFIAMNKSPADRPQSAEQFAQLLGLPIGSTASMRVMTPTMQRRIPAGAQAAVASMQRPWWRRPVVIGAASAVVLAGGLAAWRMTAGKSASPVNAGPEARRIAVLYFESGDSALVPVADGITEALTRSLSTATTFTVVSQSGAVAFRGTSVGKDSIARALRAGYLVDGSVDAEGDKVRVSLRLLDASGARLQSAAFTVPAANVVASRDTVAQKARDLIVRQLGTEFQLGAERAETSSEDAWILSQRGEAARRAMEAASARSDSADIDRQYRAADSLFAAAAKDDAKWAEPEARRALLAYRRARMTRAGPAVVRKWVDVGLQHADAALALDRDNPDALEMRGTMRYYSYLANFEEDATRKARLMADAKVDLERAVAVNRTQAGAWATLSHLYNNFPGTSATDVLLAAQRAYEADEFLSDAETVLSRLVLASYDLGQFDKANQWCTEAGRRFPTAFRAIRCKLIVLTTDAVQPDIGEAWKLADSVTAAAPPAQKDYYRLNSDMLVAGVIARASKTTPVLADSARHVIKRSEGDANVDPTRDLALYGAIAATMLGDKDEAIRLLKLHLAVNPQKLAGFRADPGWQFRSLTSDPAYRQLVGGP